MTRAGCAHFPSSLCHFHLSSENRNQLIKKRAFLKPWIPSLDLDKKQGCSHSQLPPPYPKAGSSWPESLRNNVVSLCALTCLSPMSGPHPLLWGSPRLWSQPPQAEPGSATAGSWTGQTTSESFGSLMR